MSKLKVEIHQHLHPRKIRHIEQILLRKKGILDLSVSASGEIVLDIEDSQITKPVLIKLIKSLGLKVISVTSLIGHPKKETIDSGHWILNILGSNTELYFAIISGIFWLTGFIISFIPIEADKITSVIFIIGISFGGVFTFVTAGRDLLRGKFEIDFLMLFAALGASILGKWGEANLLLFLFSLGHALEHYAMKRARKSIAALTSLAPPSALLKINGKLKEVPIEQLKIGDLIVVKPNSNIAADGVVVNGSSSVNQASITGESIPVDKHACKDWENKKISNLDFQNRVFAGTINGEGVLEIRVLKNAKDSTLSKLIELVKEAENQKSPTQHLTDKFEKFYVPLVLVLVILLMFAFVVIEEDFQQSFYRAMSVLIAASPCALAISTPSAVLAGIARAARQGVLIKGGRPLEDLGGLKAIAFDKTGTLTQGKPKLTNAIPFGKIKKSKLLKIAVAVEALSDHPLANAIVEGGKQELNITSIPTASNLKSLTARGVQAEYEGFKIYIGNRRLFEELTGEDIPQDIDFKMATLESEGHTAMIVGQDDKYLGLISVMDIARKEAFTTLAILKKMGISKMVMLTGDNQKVADAIAKTIGITDPMGSLLPEDKVNAILELKNQVGNVAMVGDGVNDAPAMAKSTVGIAMGAMGSDVALETADIALMADRLDNLPFAIGLSRKAKQIIKQNLFISLGMVAILVPLTIAGSIAIGPAVVGHEGSTLLVVLNALRLLKFEVNKY